MPVYVMTLKDPSRYTTLQDGVPWVTQKPQYWLEKLENAEGLVAQEGDWVYGAGATMSQLAPMLGRLMGRPVLDRTGVAGRFTFSLEYDVDLVPGANPNRIGPGDMLSRGSGPRNPSEINSLIAEFEKQAGVELKAQNEKVEVLVIEQVERPSEN
jgi:uncharacterized protein (TIGR03435 family)